jgi:hypothetical protein
MDIYNKTDFEHQVLGTVSQTDEFHWVCVLKMSCPFYGRKAWTRAHNGIRMKDDYYGDPAASSIRRPSDIAPFKPNAEFLLIDPVAFQYAPTVKWYPRIRVGDLDVKWQVSGPSRWRRTILGWAFEQPQPVCEVPIKFEHCYGGVDCDKVFDANPVGVGFVSRKTSSNVVECPQVWFFDDNPLSPWHDYLPAGGTAIAPAWQPRRQFGGTYNTAWRDNRWPYLPKDFLFDFYNAAPKNQQQSQYFKGNEIVEISGFKGADYIRIQLPGNIRPGLKIQGSSKETYIAMLNLDTILINFDDQCVEVVFRACFIAPEGAQCAHVLPYIAEELESRA